MQFFQSLKVCKHVVQVCKFIRKTVLEKIRISAIEFIYSVLRLLIAILL